MEIFLPGLFVTAALAAPALPNSRQMDFMEIEISQFMHFGVNTAWQPPDSFLRDTRIPPGPTYHKCVCALPVVTVVSYCVARKNHSHVFHITVCLLSMTGSKSQLHWMEYRDFARCTDGGNLPLSERLHFQSVEHRHGQVDGG